MSLNYTPSQEQRRRVTSVCLLVAAAFTAIAVLDSRAEDWEPLSLVLALVAFNVLSEVVATRDPTQSRAPWIITSTAPLVLAMTLLGAAPALAIGLLGLAVDGVRRTVPPADNAANLANYSMMLVSGALLSEWLAGAFGVSSHEAGFALLILVIYAFAVGVSVLVNALTGRLFYGESVRDQYERERGRIVGAEGPTGLLTAGTGYIYATAGLEAIGLLAVIQLTHQYLANSLMLSQQRADALQQRADELAELHATLTRQAERLGELSASRGRLVGQVLQAEETERRRLAEALHDQALQELLSARHALAAPIEGGTEWARAAMSRATDQLRDAIFDLHPAVLEHAGLGAALQEVADRQAQRAGFRVEVDVDPEACGPYDPLLFVLGREQLTNIAKHAEATKALVVLTRDHDTIVMEVSDDGCGVAPARRRAAVEQGHIGLASSAERVEALGGSLEIDSEPGRGTRIRTTLPLKAPDEQPAGEDAIRPSSDAASAGPAGQTISGSAAR